MDYFALMWFANGVALFLALMGFMMHVLGGEPSKGRKVDELTGWDPAGGTDVPLEERLTRLVKRAELELTRP